jgi:lipopolysaccharide transport system permease protein
MNWRRYLDIILYRTYAEVKSEAQVNYMGYAWWVLEPLLNTILFYAIFILIMQQSTTGALSFLLVGTIIWQWFSGAMVSSSSSIFGAGTMLKFIYLPKVVLPLISILACTWRFIFLFGLLLVWCLATSHPPSLPYLALPLLLFLQLILILGICLPVAALVPYFPDARFAVDVVLRSLMLVSCIFFSIDQVPVAYHRWVYLNPMAVLIESYRGILLHGVWPDWTHLGYVGLFGAVLIVISLGVYRKIDLSVVKSIHQ